MEAFSQILAHISRSEQVFSLVVVEDEDMAGRQAFIVLIDENGSLAAQSATVIGGGAV